MGVTQEELAWRAEMHRTYLAGIERGARNITLRSLASLARALEMSVGELLAQPAEGAKGSGAAEILLVEDIADDAELALRAFRRAGLTNPVHVARTGREALEHLLGRPRGRRRRTGRPCLVLLDINLPDISGVEVLRTIKSRAETKRIPVVMLTVSREDRHVLECSRLGAANYIVKPVEFANLSRITPQLGLRWALITSSPWEGPPPS